MEKTNMEKIINTLLRWKLELRRFFQGGEMVERDWKQLLSLRKESLTQNKK